MTTPKPMMDLPMDTKNKECSCGGPPKFIETECPECGEKGMRVKAGTVRYLLYNAYRDKVNDKIYGLCLSPDCSVAWYAQDGSHHFTTGDTTTPIWTKTDADPKYVCYCHEITSPMIAQAIDRKGLRSIEEIILHYRDEMKCSCAVKNPSGQCCFEEFEKIIAEALREYLGCRCT
ncbi:(2Fe-2S)-binding protein [Pseudodesulfovibrio sp.]|nr:(2Fe-2S)-binding protein [Pseudodesulfovibrio sp.]